jgi:hypothetical protein
VYFANGHTNRILDKERQEAKEARVPIQAFMKELKENFCDQLSI